MVKSGKNIKRIDNTKSFINGKEQIRKPTGFTLVFASQKYRLIPDAIFRKSVKVSLLSKREADFSMTHRIWPIPNHDLAEISNDKLVDGIRMIEEDGAS